MTTTVDRLVITEPGVYDIPDAVYHADPVPGGSLSNSGAKLLLPPSCPAKFAYEREHGRPVKREFEMGHAAHKLVLGVGLELELVDRDRWDTKAVKEEVAAIRERGAVPLKRDDYEQVRAMTDALRRHRLAAALLDPATGEPEQSVFWIDEQTGIWRRARFDFLRTKTSGRPMVVDYKTTDSADPDSIRRSIHRYGYYRQDPYYLDGATALGVGDDAGFLFIFQEKDPPYLVTVVELDEYDREAGRARNRRAIQLYAECVAADRWPGYADDAEILPITLPAYAHKAEETY